MSKKAKKISTYTVVSIVCSFAVGGIFAVLSAFTFAKVPMVVANININEPYKNVMTAEDFKIIEIAKGDIKNFEGFVVNPNELIGKIPVSPIYAGQPMKLEQFISPEDMKKQQEVLVSEGNRGLYLPMTPDNALVGDLKMGGVYDLYVSFESIKMTSGKETPETIVVPLQSSYPVKKYITTEGGDTYLFMEFPQEESERYVMLKEHIKAGKASVIATMPNALHKEYKGKKLDYKTYLGALESDSKYFTSISEKKEGQNLNINTNNDVDKPQTENKE